ncbi:MAG: hypothetical protein AAGK98_15320 [Pseudomonadota bacterium]
MSAQCGLPNLLRVRSIQCCTAAGPIHQRSRVTPLGAPLKGTVGHFQVVMCDPDQVIRLMAKKLIFRAGGVFGIEQLPIAG